MYKIITYVTTGGLIGSTVFFIMGKITEREQRRITNIDINLNPRIHIIPGYIIGAYLGIVWYSLSITALPIIFGFNMK